MEVWYDPDTMEVKAVYSTQYTGTVWQSRGLQRVVLEGQQSRRDMMPGARINVREPGDVEVVAPTPPPAPPPRTRLDDLRDRLVADTITDAEIREYLRLRDNL